MADQQTTTYNLTKPEVGASQDSWGSKVNANFDELDNLLDGTTAITPNLGSGWKVAGTEITASASEINKLSGLTASTEDLNNPFPSGGIIMWSGSLGSIPSGWHLCDGSNGTPDLRDRFVVGAGNSYSVGATGGADSVSLSTSEMPSHNHTFSGTTSTDGNHRHNGVLRKAQNHPFENESGTGGGSNANAGTGDNTSTFTDYAGSHNHTFSGTTSSAGGGSAHENRPPYYALAYIMKA